MSALLGALTIGAVAAGSLEAQRVERPSNTIQNPDGTAGRTIGQRGFSLFGSGDIAVTGMKQVGQMGYALTNYGPGAADGYSYTGDFGHVLVGGVWRSKYFEAPFILGAPRHEFRKIRTVYPQIGASVLGGGFTYQWNQPLLAFRGEIAPSDNSLGTIFSGIQSTTDGSCRDVSSAINGYISGGATLLPMSDCAETWGPAGWQGPRIIPDVAYQELKTRLGADFNWQYWLADPALMGGNLGNFSTFGLMTDYTTELLDSYGSVTPRSAKAPVIDGYPLGIDMKFEAFSSSLPSLANAVIWQVTLVNNSANVYGVGIDYDSLYAGMELGFYDPNQQANTYYETDRGSVLSANRGIHPACNGTRQIAGTPACAQSGGFNRGAVGVTFLKSPIGDMRNKLYTRAGAFNDPTHPRRGDTITFNHGHKCGYGACYSGNLDASVRRQFGLISSTGENVLDGRSVDDLAPTNYYYTFRNYDMPTRTGKFNYMIPAPDWDYNHDGNVDTVFFDTCHETLNNTNNTARGRNPKCVSTWSDSMPGGFVNAYGNVGGAATAGPFALKAGDTTAFVIAFTAGVDSAGIEAITNNVIEGYLNFWAGPTGPPNPRIVSTNVSGTADAPVVRITYSDLPEVWVDPFLSKYANDLETSTAPDQIRLRTLNPTLVDSIRARAASGKNFKALYVYKSCNGGATFTADADCIGDPSVDLMGKAIGNGWRPYRVINADANGTIPNVFTDQNVVAGRTYLYSFVAQSRGFATTVLDSVDGALVARTLVVADSILNPVNTAGPNVANVYVPISLAAGTSAASFQLTRDGVPFTVPIAVGLSSAAQAGTYTALVGNRFIVIDSTSATPGSPTQTTVIVQKFYANARTPDGTPIPGGAVADADTITGPGPIGIAGFTPTFTETSGGGFVVRTDTLVGTAFLLTRGGQPLYISSAPTVTETTPSTFLSSPLFPGFVLSIDTSKFGEYAGGEFAVKPPADTLPAGVFNTNGVQWAEAKSTVRNGATGQYEFTFAGDAYGPNAPFTLDVTNPTGIQTAVQQSLAARPVASTADTTAATLALVRAITGFGSANLVPAKLPFTVRNTTFDRNVTVAMLARRNTTANNTIVLGSGNDTLRIAVDSLTWLPGDTLILIETLTADSTVGGAVVIDPATGAPFQVQRTRVSFAPAVLECSSPRPSCNPLRIGSPGATGYLTYVPNTKVYVTYEAGFVPGSQFAVTITGATPSGVFGAAERAAIRVVPNPYIVQGPYDQVTGRTGTSRVYFTNVPANGQLRIYSVSGQFLQQLDWTAADLNNTGDLPYDLRTREGTDLASGLYIWTIKAQGNGKSELARGKFVVIR